MVMKIYELIEFSPYYYHKHGIKVALTLYSKLWWKFMPGTIIKVKWPVGDIVIDETHPCWDWSNGPSKYIVSSADPNDHYRPWMEAKVGKQGWDWDWGMQDTDITENKLSIKFRRGKENQATICSLRWS